MTKVSRQSRMTWNRVAAAFLFVLGSPNLVYAADPERGRELAMRWCVDCHVVADDKAGGTLGPAFSAIVPLRGRTEDQIAAWLAAPHAPMPDFGLSAREIADLVAYIASLSREGPEIELN